MFVQKDFVRDCSVAQIRAKMRVGAEIRAYLHDEAEQNPWPATIHTII